MNSPEYKFKLVVEEGAFIIQDGKKIPIEKGEYELSNEVYELDPDTNKIKKTQNGICMLKDQRYQGEKVE